MAFTTKKYLDLTGLTRYDAKIKALMDEKDAKSFKTVLVDGDNIKFYKKENAVSTEQADATVAIASSDVTAIKEKLDMVTALNALGEATTVTKILNVLTGDATTANSIAKQVADAKASVMGTTADAAGTKTIEGLVKTTGAIANDVTTLDGRLDALEGAGGAVATALREAKEYTNAEIQKLDVDDAVVAGQFVTAVSETDGKIAVTRAALKATDIPDLTLAKITDAGTAAAADVATTAIAVDSIDDSLVKASQVAAFVKDQVADLTGAMHFRGIFDNLDAVTEPQAGDVAIVGVKEYVYADGVWKELGDEGMFVAKTTTIAGVDLQNNITKEELLAGLGVADGAQVNVIEGVKVNGADLVAVDKKVNVTIAEGATNGTLAVNGTDVAVHGLGSAAFAGTDAFDAAGAAQDAYDAIGSIETASIEALFTTV